MNKKGFTLIEVIVVVAILGILALIVLPNFVSTFKKSSTNAMITQENEVVDTVQMFLEDYCRTPLQSKKGQCDTYSVPTSVENQKYTCLSSMQANRYIDDLIFQDQVCSGFVIYTKSGNRDYGNYKAYLKCGGYETEGLYNIKDSHGDSIASICIGEITPTPVDPVDPTPTPTPDNPTNDNYENTTTAKLYSTLKAAFSEVETNQTIRVLNNVKEVTNAPLENNKNVTLNLNGKTITFENSSLVNNGNLTITNGTITGNSTRVITNNNEITTTGTTSIEGTSRSISARVIYNDSNIANLTLNSGTTVQFTSENDIASDNSWRYTITTKGIVELNGANVVYTKTGNDSNVRTGGISIGGSTGRVIVRTGIINTNGCAIFNNDSTSTSNPAVLVQNGTITSIKDYGIANKASGTIDIEGGSITGKLAAVYNRMEATGTINIKGGTITSEQNAISIKNGIVNLGVDDTSVSQTVPYVKSTGSSGGYGVYAEEAVNREGIFNLYDGIIESNSGTGTALYLYNNGTTSIPNKIPKNYLIDRKTTSNVETVTLKSNLPTTTYTATFYYNSNTTAGNLTVATATSTCSFTTGTSCTVTIPSVVTTSVGKYNSTYVNISETMATLSSNPNQLTIDSDTVFFAYYSKKVTNYYYNGSTYTTKDLYRNEYFDSKTSMTSRLATSSTSKSNVTTETGPGSSTFAGYSTAQDSTPEYTSVQAAADSSATTLYSVYSIRTNFSKGANVSAIGSTNISCNVVSNNTSCSITLPTITASEGYESVGWNTTNGATSGTPALGLYTATTNNTTLYANTKLSDTTGPTIRVTGYRYDPSKSNNVGTSIKSVSTFTSNGTFDITSWRNYGATFKMETSDSESGVKQIVWKWNTTNSSSDTGSTYPSGNSSTYTSDFATRYPTLTAQGFRRGQWIATDNAGNTTTVSVVVRIDTSSPTASVTDGANCSPASGYAHCWEPYIRDNLSGIGSYRITTTGGEDVSRGPYSAQATFLNAEELNTYGSYVSWNISDLCDVAGNCTSTGQLTHNF